MKSFIKPHSLRPGDTIAAISISGGRAGDPDLLWRYELGKKRLEEDFALHVVETPHTPKSIWASPTSPPPVWCLPTRG